MRWCDSQPAMVEHNGLCQVHRAEVLELGGAWADALDAAELAADRFDQGVLNQFASGKARYRQGEIHRLRGEFDAAEEAFREARCAGTSRNLVSRYSAWDRATGRRRRPPSAARCVRPCNASLVPDCCPHSCRSCWLPVRWMTPRVHLLNSTG